LATAFEAQRFIMNNKSANPLLFADELDTNIHYPSNFSYQFFGPAGIDPSIRYMLVAWNKNDAEFMMQREIMSDSPVPGYYGGQNNYTPYVTDMEFYVAPIVTPNVAAKTYEKFTAPFPADTNWIPGTIPEIPWCQSAGIREVNGYEKTCYKYYRGASRLRYGIGAWVDSDWVNTFTNYNDELFSYDFRQNIKNPVSGIWGGANNDPSRFEAIPELGRVWNAAASAVVWDTIQVAARDFSNEGWFISPRRLNKRYVNDTTTLFAIRSPDFTPTLEQYASNSNWVVKFDSDSSITNAGELKGAKDTLAYIRSQDTTKQTDAHVVSGGVELITQKRIFSQNSNHEMVRILGTDSAWLRNILFTGADLRTRGDSAHLYFAAEPDVARTQITVTRTHNNPDKRAEEMITLRGRVPGAGTKYTLSYLKNGNLFSLASGTQEDSATAEFPYPIEYLQNANKLQGNTSYFLTFGGAGNENVFFKQLDVRMGTSLDNTKDTLIQSMYRNVSVLFPPGAFESQTDITVRTASLGDYGGYETFRGFDPVGVVLEVLPHHQFPDSAQPQVSIWLSKEDIQGKNPLDIKVYKPDTTRNELVLLNRQELGFYDKEKSPITGFDQCTESAPCLSSPPGFEFIKVSARTSSFSMFMLMDSSDARNANAKLQEPGVEFACSDTLRRDTTLWMGTYNGYLQYPYPCNSKASYLLQLRHGSEVVKETQGSTAENIVWNVRRGEITAALDSFTTRLTVFDPNGSSSQMPGPFVRADSIPPEIKEPFELFVLDSGASKRVVVEANVGDAGSGVAMVNIHYYFAGRLVKLDAIASDTIITSELILGKEEQADCIGCKVQVQITVEDAGHNYVKRTAYTESIYPYPASLALWYPLSEGSGNVTREILGSGMDLSLLNVKNPWNYGTSVYFFNASDHAGSSTQWNNTDSSALSVEFSYRAGVTHTGFDYAILNWDGTDPWSIGVTRVNELFFEYDNKRTIFANSLAASNVNAHYVFTVDSDSNRVSLYRDGKHLETKPLETANPGKRFIWNQRGKPHLGQIFNVRPVMPGAIAALRFYRSVLAQGQVEDLHEGFQNITQDDFTVVRAVDILNRENLLVDQSCELPGFAFLKQKNANDNGSMTWSVNPGNRTYQLFVYSRGYPGQNAGVEVYLNGTSKGIYPVSDKGVFEANKLAGLRIPGGAQSIKIRPVGQTEVAALALASSSKSIAASQVKWNEGRWKTPEPVVNVQMAYQNFADKSWVRPQFKFANTSGETLQGVKLRYYYRGEGAEVLAKTFYPDAPMSIHADAGDVYYAEFTLTEAIPPYGAPYWANGPQMGLHRTDYRPWHSEDDPSFEANVTNGIFAEMDKVALLDEEGNLLNSWSCFEAGGGVKEPVLPKVRALAKDTKITSDQSSLIHLAVENTGTAAIQGFESRYYFRIENGEIPAWNVYYNPNAQAQLVKEDGDLYYVSFIYENTILNPGEITENGTGVSFELYYPDWNTNWNTGNDPSHAGISETLAPVTAVAVLDLWGNLLWGSIPGVNENGNTPPHSPVIPSGKLRIDSDGVIVQIDVNAVYILEAVNAAGIPLQTLFNGSLSEGEHFISTENKTLSAGNYLVLRRGNTIISRVLIL
jgi:hypothetical protein